ncbi:hypothetical protein HXX76_001748 [Chlamydomonas incerta]|uniref:Uncharacterized protein n=1 Tax=Chlamydomonas incerta TaxID=51695 RepID=A0A835TH04_CHLIN|nr:hypothetical protein HXX76_001748 [Chlamydomonas incerta]|eukprot:KAG2443388.1 hypothetical protein HXX76_001748 [Chlamydomonas incerta]
MSGDELPGIGALAACPRLRELTITCAESLKLTDDMVEGLSRLQHLQSLSLVCRWLGGFPALTQVLLGARRPPHVRTISVKIPIQYHTFSFQLEYGRLSAPGAAASVTAAAAGAGGPVEGILRVTVCKGSRGHMLMAPMESMAELVLGAAAELRQRRIPELVIQELDTGSWEPPEMVEPGEPLSRLLARCSRVDLGSFKVYSSQTPWVAAATARLFGLPRELSLCHHLWGCSADTLAMLAVEPRQRVQEQQQQQQVQPTLLFDPLNPRELQEVAKQVIQDAAAQLWTQAAGSIGAIVGRHGSGSGTAIVLLRGPLPGSPHFEAEDREWERWLRDTLCQWFGGPQPQPPQPPQPQGAQRQQQGQAAQELGKRSWDTRDRQPDDVPDAAASPAAADRAARGLPVAAGAAGGPDDAVAAVAAAVAAGAAVAPPQLQEFGVLLGSCAVAAPTAGIVLVECWTRAHAAELVELLGETTAAHGGGGGGGGAPVRAAVLPVGLPGVTAEVQEVWESAVIKAILATVRRSAPTPAHAEAAAAYGTNANAAANAVLPAAAAAAVRGGAALEEAPARIDGALLGRLDALVRLDIAVRGLWQDMQCWNLRGLDSEREEAEEAEELEEEEGGMEALLGLEEDAAEEWAEEWAEAEEEEEQEAEEGQEEVGNEVLRLEEDVEMGVGQGFGG